ncbi:MAG: hypothetical protein K2M95_07285 [Clostridiales bacterium]|nr:hypothetical protein [Clostridiales bacterium]
MKKTNRLVVFIVALCMVFTGAMLLVGCGDKDNTPPPADKSDAAALKAAAGTYTNTWYESGYEGVTQETYTLEITTAKKWKMTINQISGLSEEKGEATGTFEINANKELIEFHFDNFADSFNTIEKFAGITLPSEEDDEEYTAIDELRAEEQYKEMIKVHDGYVSLMDYYFLYREGTQKFAAGTIFDVLTQKGVNEMATYYEAPVYESDYYFVKAADEVDLTDDDQKAAALEQFPLMATVADAYGNKTTTQLEVTDISALQLATVGTRSTTLTYKNGSADATKVVTYTVVENDEDLPENGVRYIDSIGKDLGYYVSQIDRLPLEKGSEIYEAGLVIQYQTYSRFNSSQEIEVNEENVTGDDAVITITGYNKNTVGAQIVTFTLKGKSTQLLVFVYDDNTNPVYNVEAQGVVMITKDGDNYTVSYENATAQEIKISEEYGEEVTFTAADAINLRSDLSTYKTGDTLIFKYVVTYGGNTYTIYVQFTVVVVPATPAE